MQYIAVKNFERFQHYRDRRPPWIKLYNDLLDDYAFTRLQDASKMHLVLIWLLASRHDNRVPLDPEWLARAIHATSPIDIDALVSAGFLTVVDDRAQDDSTPIASRSVSAMPETEGEGETETEATATTSARGAIEPLGLGEYEADAAALIRSSSAPTAVRQTLVALMDPGQHPVPYTPAEVGLAVRDLAANGERFNARRFRAYCERAREQLRGDTPTRAPATRRSGRGELEAEAAQVLAEIRKCERRSQGSKYVDARLVKQLGEAAWQAYKAIGGADRILALKPDQLAFLVRDFAAAYVAAVEGGAERRRAA